ncbi:hypothetical protein DLH72_04345, partial [Candidatus Gracilibacteria bacterium]
MVNKMQNKGENLKKVILAAGLAASVNSVQAETRQSVLDNSYKNDNYGWEDVNFSGNQNSLNFRVDNNESSYSAGLDFVKDSPIVGLEYKKVGDVWGTVATLKVGKETKSFLLTGIYNGSNFSAKATAGQARIDGINQSYLGAEVKKAISEGLAVSFFANKTHTGDKTFSVTEVEKIVNGGKEIWTTTKKFEGHNTSSVGMELEYVIDERNKLNANASVVKIAG